MYKKNTIVLLPFPFTDLSAVKIRPAVIVSNTVDGEDVIVVFISTKKTKRFGKTDILIKSSDRDFSKTGLKTDSVIKVGKIATLEKKIILGELGVISLVMEKEISKKMALLFSL